MKIRPVEVRKLGLMTNEQQELYLIEDLLCSLMSFNGSYIKRVPVNQGGKKFLYRLEQSELTAGHGRDLLGSHFSRQVADASD
jgi:hypothetical protein